MKALILCNNFKKLKISIHHYRRKHIRGATFLLWRKPKDSVVVATLLLSWRPRRTAILSKRTPFALILTVIKQTHFNKSFSMLLLLLSAKPEICEYLLYSF